MKNQTLIRTMNKFFLAFFVMSVSLIAGCSDDPESTNEEEVITTITISLAPMNNPEPEVGDTIRLSWDDANLDAIVDASEVSTTGPLHVDSAYSASIQILNKSADPDIDITLEIEEEAEEHIFCFTVATVGVSIETQDEDKNGLPLGLTSTWTTTSTASSGTVTITLRHQPGVKTGDCPGAGDTDVNITFPVSVAFPNE